MKIIRPEKTYDQALIDCGIDTEQKRSRETMDINLIKEMKEPMHKPNDSLPPKVGQMRKRDTRLNQLALCQTTHVSEKVVLVIFEYFVKSVDGFIPFTPPKKSSIL